MLTRFSDNRWTLAVRGVLAILFGILAFSWPVALLSTFVLIFGAYAFLDGVIALVASARFAHEHERWLPLLVEGIVGIVTGLIVFFHPVAALVALIWIAGFWALVTGILAIVAALRLRRHVPGEWLLGLTGVFSVIVGIILLAHPLAAATAYIWVLGIYAVISGIALLVLSVRMREIGATIAPQLP